MPPFKRTEQPLVATRLRGAIKIKVGPDLTDILGLDPTAVDAAVASKAVDAALTEVGTIESLDFVQSREVRARYAFGPTPQQAFQVVPLNQKITLRASRVVLKSLQKAEAVFNFLPSNLIFQQIPFVIQIDDIGDPANPETRVTHILYGCWFTSSTVKYDVMDKNDQRLIQSVDITAARVFTLDGSNAGSTTAQIAKASFSGIQSVESAQPILEDYTFS